MLRYSFLVSLVLAFFCLPGLSQTKNQPLTGQSFRGEITIDAAPDRIWQILTDVGQLTGLLGYEYVGGARKFGKVGDEAHVKVWGDAGNFTLVRTQNGKELRFNLDPENGTYICNCRWLLSKSGNGTKLRFEERYTESGPQSKEELEAQVKETNSRLKKIKQMAETN